MRFQKSQPAGAATLVPPSASKEVVSISHLTEQICEAPASSKVPLNETPRSGASGKQ